jgi:hypothetical protein
MYSACRIDATNAADSFSDVSFPTTFCNASIHAAQIEIEQMLNSLWTVESIYIYVDDTMQRPISLPDRWLSCLVRD